ncbi:hypothetical protein D3C81_2151610 [compost metagenome]
MLTGPGQFVDTAGITLVGRLDQPAEGNPQRFGNQVERSQADVLLTGLDRHQHAPADT